jgi:4-amino-4-deoxy-L-arabinose transferase-like glycosyltransferase
MASSLIGRRISALVWTVGLFVVGLIAIQASLALLLRLRQIAIHFPGDAGRSGLALTFLGVVASAVAIYAVARLGRRSNLTAFVVGMALLIGLRLVAILLIDAPQHNDPLFQNQLALGVLKGQCCFSHRPMGYPIALGVAYAAFGTHIAVAEILNLAFATATGALLYDLVRREWGAAPAAGALAIYAVMPSQILLTPVTLSETMYGFVLTATVWAALMPRARRWIAAATAGILLGLSQYVRPTSMALLPALLLVPVLGGTGLRRILTYAALTIAVFVAVLLPVLEFNLRAHNDLSLSTSAYAGWSLYVGTNQKFDGQWNREDAARLAKFPGDSTWDRSEVAGREGIKRIIDDPAGFAALVVRKFNVLWGNENYGPDYAIGPTFNGRVKPSLRLLSHVLYIGLLLLTLLALVTDRDRRPTTASVILVMVVTVVAVHVFVEVTGRYHAYVIPLLCALAGSAVGRLVIWRDGPRSEATGSLPGR